MFNGRVINQKENEEAEIEANKLKLLKGLGTDSHHPREFGRSYMEIKDFDSVQEFKKNLKKATFHKEIIPFHLKAYVNSWSILRNRVIKTLRI